MLTLGSDADRTWFTAECSEHGLRIGGARESWVNHQVASHFRKVPHHGYLFAPDECPNAPHPHEWMHGERCKLCGLDSESRIV